MGETFEFPIRSVQRLLYKAKYGKVLGSVSGDVSLTIDKLPSNTVEDEYGSVINFAITSHIFSGGKFISQNGFNFTIQTGTDYVSLEFTKEHLLSVNASVPIAIAKLNLADLPLPPEKKATGTVQLNITLEVLFIPNYRALARKGAREILEQIAKGAKNVVTRAGRGIRVAVRFGLKALSKPLMLYLDSLGRKIAIKAIKLGSQTAAVKNIIGGYAKWLGRAGGAAAIALDVYIFIEEIKPGLIKKRGDETLKFLSPNFREGYATMLANMTDPKSKNIRSKYYQMGGKVQRIVGQVPDRLETIEVLKKTGELKSSGPRNWYMDIRDNGPKFTANDVYYIEMNWDELFREAFNSYWSFHTYKAYSVQKRRENGRKMVHHARVLSIVAGRAAAYHDILEFVLASGIYENGNGNIEPNIMWEDWDGVMLLHQKLYGKEKMQRYAKYQNIAKKLGKLRPEVLPFS